MNQKDTIEKKYDVDNNKKEKETQNITSRVIIEETFDTDGRHAILARPSKQ